MFTIFLRIPLILSSVQPCWGPSSPIGPQAVLPSLQCYPLSLVQRGLGLVQPNPTSATIISMTDRKPRCPRGVGRQGSGYAQLNPHFIRYGETDRAAGCPSGRPM
jgi:hypothetical protein